MPKQFYVCYYARTWAGAGETRGNGRFEAEALTLASIETFKQKLVLFLRDKGISVSQEGISITSIIELESKILQEERGADIKAMNDLLIQYRNIRDGLQSIVNRFPSQDGNQVIAVTGEVEAKAVAAIERLSGKVVKPASVERNTCPQCGKDTTGADRIQGAWCHGCLQEGGE